MLYLRNSPFKLFDRAGVDINPLDPIDRLDHLRLLSYTWVNQCDRLERIKQIAPNQTTKVEEADAADWLPNRLKAQRAGTLHFVLHTIALQYSQKKGMTKLHAYRHRQESVQQPDSPWDMCRW